jgi:FkbM family methyltransferase
MFNRFITKFLTPARWGMLGASIAQDRAALGTWGAGSVAASQFLTILMKDFGWKNFGWSFGVQPADLEHRFHFRACSSDPYTIRQVFVCREHDDLLQLDYVKLVVDCGANIGCAAVRFLSHYPQAQVIAIEPDSKNFAVLEGNLAPYGKRATAMRAAVWNEDRQVVSCSRGTYADGLDWATTVSRAEDGGGDTPTVSLYRLLDESGFPAIDILKVDIEGAERLLFDENCHSWLSRTRNLCVELHGEDCRQAFDHAMQSYGGNREEVNELTICRDLHRLHAEVKIGV